MFPVAMDFFDISGFRFPVCSCFVVSDRAIRISLWLQVDPGYYICLPDHIFSNTNHGIERGKLVVSVKGGFFIAESQRIAITDG
jgi:hypothetical protein